MNDDWYQRLIDKLLEPAWGVPVYGLACYAFGMLIGMIVS